MKIASPDHGRIRSVCKRHRELVRVLLELDGSCMPKLRQVYSQAVNMLIRCACCCIVVASNCPLPQSLPEPRPPPCFLIAFNEAFSCRLSHHLLSSA